MKAAMLPEKTQTKLHPSYSTFMSGSQSHADVVYLSQTNKQGGRVFFWPQRKRNCPFMWQSDMTGWFKFTHGADACWGFKRKEKKRRKFRNITFTNCYETVSPDSRYGSGGRINRRVFVRKSIQHPGRTCYWWRAPRVLLSGLTQPSSLTTTVLKNRLSATRLSIDSYWFPSVGPLRRRLRCNLSGWHHEMCSDAFLYLGSFPPWPT